MNQKELSELRRRWKPEKSAVGHIYGCFVNSAREIVADLDESLALMPQQESEKYLELLRKAMSGTPDKNLIDIVFETQQVMKSDEHKLLMALRDSELKDNALRQTFYQKVISTLNMGESNYLLLIANDHYDVPRRGKDGLAQEDASETVFSYLVCAVCPVKAGKPELGYFAGDNEFHCTASQLVSAPELGFLFPAFDGRQTNLYNCLYYTRSAGDNHPELIEALFHITPPLPADEQKGSFDALLSQTLGEECSMEVVQAVQTDLRERIEVHKETKSDEPLVVSGPEVRAVLENAGVSEEKLAGFQVKFEETFGDDAALSPRNLVDSERMRGKSRDCIIHVAPDRGDLVETRTLGGVKYIMVRAEDGVELNGVDIQIDGN